MVSITRLSRTAAVAAMIAFSASSSFAGPTNYDLLTTISVPTSNVNDQPGGAFTGFDISFFDPVTGRDYVADRSNAAVDIFSGASLSFLGRATGFAGQQAVTALSGPNGVLVTGSSLFAGDSISTVRTFDVTNPAAPALLFPPINTGGSFRADEMSYSPTANLVLVANNADTPPFATLINASTGAIVHANITIPNAIGLEQSVWDPATGTFFISVPFFGPNSNDPGGVAEIKTDGTVGRIFQFASMGITSCSATGLALGASGNLLVNCGNSGTQTILLNPAGTGSIVTTFAQISGGDEVWYDPTMADFFVTGQTVSGRAFDVISDGTDAILQSVNLPDVVAHSIAVDPSNGDVFVPLEGTAGVATDALCPLGCIAVYSQSVPEPGTLSIFATALLGLVVCTLARLRLR